MMSGELNISKEMIRQILHKDLWKVCAKFVQHRLMDGLKQWILASCQDFNQICQDNPSFLDCIIIFSKVKTALKERSFRMLKTLRKT
jgi:hypothetical protein